MHPIPSRAGEHEQGLILCPWEDPGVKILPEDPLVRWLILLIVGVSVGVPVLWALVLTL